MRVSIEIVTNRGTVTGVQTAGSYSNLKESQIYRLLVGQLDFNNYEVIGWNLKVDTMPADKRTSYKKYALGWLELRKTEIAQMSSSLRIARSMSTDVILELMSRHTQKYIDAVKESDDNLQAITYAIEDAHGYLLDADGIRLEDNNMRSARAARLNVSRFIGWLLERLQELELTEDEELTETNLSGVLRECLHVLETKQCGDDLNETEQTLLRILSRAIGE